MPATGPNYASFCLEKIAGGKSDLVDLFVLEWAENESESPPASMEYVMRTLLLLPSKPVVMMYIHCGPRTVASAKCKSTAQMNHWNLASYYSLPALRLNAHLFTYSTP